MYYVLCIYIYIYVSGFFSTASLLCRFVQNCNGLCFEDIGFTWVRIWCLCVCVWARLAILALQELCVYFCSVFFFSILMVDCQCELDHFATAADFVCVSRFPVNYADQGWIILLLAVLLICV